MPDSLFTADTLGWAYYRTGSADPAISQLKAVVQKAPNNPTYQYHLGMAYMAGGHPDLARAALQMALKDDPNFPQAAEAVAALQKTAKPKAR